MKIHTENTQLHHKKIHITPHRKYTKHHIENTQNNTQKIHETPHRKYTKQRTKNTRNITQKIHNYTTQKIHKTTHRKYTNLYAVYTHVCHTSQLTYSYSAYKSQTMQLWA